MATPGVLLWERTMPSSETTRVLPDERRGISPERTAHTSGWDRCLPGFHRNALGWPA